ncbi:DUF4405 domain-containing protein [Sulfurospirillum arcachonense]|uniref:DUF4405 domain-containing protein n=1 Tax=Sulfurospirillum arcachonense TaxID=57666 RepID=UPI000469587C|nr:DUF4405 domain-containing protein [Sulfurospirillum arcachonense]
MVNLRRFTSLCITFAFLIMVYTGIMLFIVPQGKIAYWTNWELFGLSKTQYGSLHVTFMVLFLVGMVLHLYLNWKPLISYLKNKNQEFTLLTKEFLLSLIFTLAFLFGTLYEIPPFKTFLDFEDSIKTSWEEDGGIPPYGHAELSSLKSLCKKTDIDLNKAIATLKNKGFIGVSANKKLLDIAEENGYAPNAVYNLIDIEENEIIEEHQTKKQNIKISKIPKMGSGLGKLTLNEASQKYGLDLNKALNIIHKIAPKITQESTMKTIAEELETTPMELFEKLM